MNEENPSSAELVKIDTGDKVSDIEKTPLEDVAVDKTSVPRSGKRKARDGQSPQVVKKKASGFQQKNALQKLNELIPGLKYVLESEKGSASNPQFEVFVHVNGRDFIGQGRSKQKAKLAAAQAALATFDISEVVNVIHQRNGFKEEILITSGATTVKADPIKIINEAHNKSPIQLLNELHPGLTYNLVEENSANPSQRFRMSVEVNCKTYEGTGQKKKLAKVSAARAVVSALYKECYSLYVKYLLAQSDNDDDDDDNVDDDDDLFALPQELADKMETMHL